MNKKHLIGENASSLDVLGVTPSISKVLLFYDDENAFISENGTEGYTIEAFCPSATQEMADNILASVSDYAHKGFSASDVQLPPIAEMGDWLSINGEWYRMCERDLEFGPASLSNVSAPAEKDVDHEYPYLTATQRALNRKVTLGKSYYGTKIDRAIGLQITKTNPDGSENSRAIMNSDTLAFYDANGNPSIYFDADTGKYNFYGDVTVTGGSININDNFVVDQYGNVKMFGVLEWGAGSSPHKAQFSTDGETDWHDTMSDEDMYKRESYDGGKTWSAAYKFRGQDGADGSDADVPSYIKRTYISSVEIRSPTITGNEIRALGSFQVGYGSTDSFVGTGFMGYARGLGADNTVTYGVALSNTESLEDGDNYVIVTNGGARMQGGHNNIFVTPDVVGIEAASGAVVRITVGAKEFEFTEDGFYIDGTKIG